MISFIFKDDCFKSLKKNKKLYFLTWFSINKILKPFFIRKSFTFVTFPQHLKVTQKSLIVKHYKQLFIPNDFQTLWIPLIRFILHQWKTFLVLLSNKKETILRMADKERKKGKESILLNDFPRRRRHLGGGAKRKGRKHQTNKSLQYIFSSFLTVMNDPSSYEIAS